MTIKELKANSIKRLLSKGVDINSANLDVSVLLSFVLNIKREFLLSYDDRELYVSDVERYNSLLERRYNDEPMAYIIGKKEFYGLDFRVNNSVLIPRPETEELIDLVLELVLGSQNQGSHIIDIGTGSGCIAITLKLMLQKCNITALDISKEAINIAKENAHLVIGRKSAINFVNADALSYTPPKKFDILVSNPPYISYADKKTLSNDVINYEPHLALFGGKNGYEFYEQIYSRLEVLLISGGKFVFEIGHDQETILAQTFANKNVSFIKDMSGKKRFMIGSTT